MRLYFTPADYLKMSAGFWLCRIVIGSVSKNCETSCSGGVTRCNLSRSIAKSRSCFYFLCNLQSNFSLRDQLQTWGVTRGSFPCNLQCNAIALQVAMKISSCDMALNKFAGLIAYYYSLFLIYIVRLYILYIQSISLTRIPG